MSKHVLLIDDDKFSIAVLSDILGSVGYKVSTAEDVIYCNDIIYSKAPPDVILMDVNLPFMSGDHKTRIMKSRPKSSAIPIVLISSMDENDLQALAIDCGADGFLTKPVNVDHLTSTLQRLICA